MAQNQLYGTVSKLNIIAPADVTSGQPYLIGALFGVFLSDAKAGELVAFQVDSAFELPKAAGALTMGQRVYFKDGEITPTAAGAVEVGVAIAPAAAGAPTASVLLGVRTVVGA